MKSSYTQEQLGNMSISRFCAFAIPENELERVMLERLDESIIMEERIEELESELTDREKDVQKLIGVEDGLRYKVQELEGSLSKSRDFIFSMYWQFTSNLENLKYSGIDDGKFRKDILEKISC